MKKKFAHLWVIVPLLMQSYCKTPDKSGPKKDRIYSHLRIEKIGDLSLSQQTQQKCKAPLTSINRSNGLAIKFILAGADDKNSCADTLAQDMLSHLAKQRQFVKNDDISNVQNVDYDVLVVGAGLHSSIFNINISNSFPNSKVLTIDNEQFLAKHFYTNLYRINSPENTPQGSANEFLNSPVQLRDFTTEKFPIAHALWNEIVFTQFLSKSDFLFETYISEIKKVKLNGKDVYNVSLGNLAANVFVSKIVIATGLGVPKFISLADPKFEASQMESARNCTDLACLPKVFTIDDFFVMHRRLREKKINIVKIFDGKKIAVVGAGDAGNILVELLFCGGPEEAYEREAKPRPASLVWVGQKSKTYADFDKTSKPRYKNSFFQNLFLKQACGGPVDFQTSDGRAKSLVARDDRLTLNVTKENGPNSSLDVDFVIVAAGYENSVHKVVSSLLSKSELERAKIETHVFFPHLYDNGSHVARRFVRNGVKEDIYVIGTAAMPLATDDELAKSITKNAASINCLGPLTVEMVKNLGL